MTAEYPKEAQNPPTIPGARPDQQPAPRVRVPDPNEKPGPDGHDRKQTTQEEPEAGLAVPGTRELPPDDSEGSVGDAS